MLDDPSMNLWRLNLLGLRELQCTKGEAEKHLMNMAHTSFCIPGDPGFVLSGIMAPPANKAEAGAASNSPVPIISDYLLR